MGLGRKRIDDQLLDVTLQHPILINRPIVAADEERARILAIVARDGKGETQWHNACSTFCSSVPATQRAASWRNAR
jgi:hypothetical protein